MFIKIIAAGKLKHKTFVGLAEDYIIRLNKWHLNIIEVKDHGEMIKKTAEEITKHIEKDYFTVVMDEVGEEMNSKKFAEFIKKHKDLGHGRVCFIIGGAFGLPEEFKNSFNMRLSFGKMTFTHQFVRVLLLEQLYRAFTIIIGKDYHY
jgi:23S rRNA (pseudouridine1915-N3)-methyltransferase